MNMRFLTLLCLTLFCSSTYKAQAQDTLITVNNTYLIGTVTELRNDTLHFTIGQTVTKLHISNLKSLKYKTGLVQSFEKESHNSASVKEYSEQFDCSKMSKEQIIALAKKDATTAVLADNHETRNFSYGVAMVYIPLICAILYYILWVDDLIYVVGISLAVLLLLFLAGVIPFLEKKIYLLFRRKRLGENEKLYTKTYNNEIFRQRFNRGFSSFFAGIVLSVLPVWGAIAYIKRYNRAKKALSEIEKKV